MAGLAGFQVRFSAQQQHRPPTPVSWAAVHELLDEATLAVLANDRPGALQRLRRARRMVRRLA